MELNEITGQKIDAGMKVHSALGPGLLESSYEACLLFELHKRGLRARSQVELPVIYEDVKIDAGYRIDLLVEEAVIVEIKAVERVIPIHEAQLLSYLKLSGKKVGLLLNFNVTRFKDGIKRMVLDFEEQTCFQSARFSEDQKLSVLFTAEVAEMRRGDGTQDGNSHIFSLSTSTLKSESIQRSLKNLT